MKTAATIAITKAARAFVHACEDDSAPELVIAAQAALDRSLRVSGCLKGDGDETYINPRWRPSQQVRSLGDVWGP